MIDDNVWVETLVNLNFLSHILQFYVFEHVWLHFDYPMVSKKKLLLFQLKKALRLRSQSWRLPLLMTFMNYVCKGSRCVKELNKGFFKRSYVRSPICLLTSNVYTLLRFCSKLGIKCWYKCVWSGIELFFRAYSSSSTRIRKHLQNCIRKKALWLWLFLIWWGITFVSLLLRP